MKCKQRWLKLSSLQCWAFLWKHSGFPTAALRHQVGASRAMRISEQSEPPGMPGSEQAPSPGGLFCCFQKGDVMGAAAQEGLWGAPGQDVLRG